MSDGAAAAARVAASRTPASRAFPRARVRVAFAAAHVAADPERLDWDATLAFRQHLWGLGLGVAEAMDTAQRGMGLDWPDARELIRRSAAEKGGRLAAGAATDHAQPRTRRRGARGATSSSASSSRARARR